MSIDGLGIVHNFAEYYEKSLQAALEKKYYLGGVNPLAGGEPKKLDLGERIRHLFFNESYSLKRSLENCTFLEMPIKQQFKQCRNLTEMEKLFNKLYKEAIDAEKDAINAEKDSLLKNLKELNKLTLGLNDTKKDNVEEPSGLSTLVKEITEFFKKITHLLGLKKEETYQILPEIQKINGACPILNPLKTKISPLLSDAVIECFSNLRNLIEENKKLKSQIEGKSQSNADEQQQMIKKLETDNAQLQKDAKRYKDTLETTQKQLESKDQEIAHLQNCLEDERKNYKLFCDQTMLDKTNSEKQIQDLQKSPQVDSSPTSSSSPGSVSSSTPPQPVHHLALNPNFK